MSGLPLAALSGVLLVGGVVLLAYGLRTTHAGALPPRTGPTQTGPTQSGPTQSGPTQSGPTQSGPTQSGPRGSAARTWARLTRRPAGPAGRRRDLLLLAGLAGGVIAFALTGWLLALPLVPLLVMLVPWLLSAPANRDIALLEALDRWIRTLAATLPTGRSIADAIRASRRTAPEVIAEPVSLLVARLDDRWTSRDALFAFADDLDSPDADAVVAALVLAAHRGGTGATATLAALADTVQDRLRALREIETERAKPRAVVQQVTMITGVVLVGALLVGRSFFEPYQTPLGQAILAGLITVYLGSLVVLRRMTVPRRRPRILVRGADAFADRAVRS